MVKNKYKYTMIACFLGYITQAIMLNFPPLLFAFFGTNLGVSPFEISILISSNFALEIIVDIIASKYAERVGYKKLIIVAEIFATLGLASMALSALILPSNFVYFGLVASMMLCGIGGGLMEVLISPIIEACPTKNKAGIMSLLHSFYCWGQLAVVLLSTIFFRTAGIENWPIAAFAWTIVPIVCFVLFTFAPVNHLVEDGQGMSLSGLLKNKMFWIFLVMMLCAGASELSMAQWASYFAETALHVEKWVGDLLGPCLFAFAMAITRVFFAKASEKIKLDSAIFVSTIICVVTYLIAIISPNPIFSLVGCACCGFGCAVLWPSTFSLSSSKIPNGGALMFGILALMGDSGCLVGPSLTGIISEMFGNDIRYGFIFALIFPIVMLVLSLVLIIHRKKDK